MRCIFIISFFVFVLASPSLAQTCAVRDVDSLISDYQKLDDSDSNKLAVCNRIINTFNNVDSVKAWADNLFRLATFQGNAEYISQAYIAFAWSYFGLNQYDSIAACCYKGLSICDSCNIKYHKAYLLDMLGSLHTMQSNYHDAESEINEAIGIFQEIKDTVQVLECYRHLAILYDHIMAFNLCDEIMDLVISKDSSNGKIYDLARDYVFQSLFNINHYMNTLVEPDINWILKAKRLALNAVKHFDSEYRVDIVDFRPIIVSMYYELMHYKYTDKRRRDVLDSMYSFCLDSDTLAVAFDTEYNHFYAHQMWAYYYIASGELAKARSILDSLQESATLISLPDIALLNRKYYELAGDMEKALYWSDVFTNCCIEQLSPADVVESTQNHERIKYEEERKIWAISQARRNILHRAALVVALIAFGFVSFVYYRKRKHSQDLDFRNTILSQRNEEILRQSESIRAQREELEIQNEHILHTNRQITASINSASLIQHAVLPDGDLMRNLFGDYFVLYRPLDIVAGDFYWASKVGRYHVLVCADCTGHGVSGAFVSMLGVSLLNEVTANLSEECKASDILENLRTKLMKSLKQSKQAYEQGIKINRDGMDLAMVMIDYENLTLQYAGAHRPLWIWREGQIIEYKPDRMPIGLYLGEDNGFTNHDIDIRHGDVLYMFSDGIPDQFGYVDNQRIKHKHFTAKRLNTLLSQIGDRPMSEQKSRVAHDVDEWKNGYKQIDDNILIGVRV